MYLNCFHLSNVKSSILFVLVLQLKVCLAKDVTTVSDVDQEEESTVSPALTSLTIDVNLLSFINNSIIKRNNFTSQIDNEITTNSEILKLVESTTTQLDLVDDLLVTTVISKINSSQHNDDAGSVDASGLHSKLSERNNKLDVAIKPHLNESHEQQSTRLTVINPETNEIAEANKSEPFPEVNRPIQNINNSFKRRIGLDEEPYLTTNLSNIREDENKIIISSSPITTHKPEVLNMAEFSDEHLDAWRPVWPFPKLDAVPIKPTVRFPSITGHFTNIEPTPLFGGSNVDNFSVAKEPVTAYYFDLSSAIPVQPAGPLYDSVHSHPVNKLNVTDTNDALNHPDLSLLESSFDDYIQNSNLKLPGPIVSTPTINQSDRTIQETDLSNHVNSSVIFTIPATNIAKVQLSSLYNQSYQINNLSVEYTLGNASDFQFDQGVSIPNEHITLVDPGLRTAGNSSVDVRHTKTDSIPGDILSSSFESDFNASLKSSNKLINSSAFLLDVDKDNQDISSDALSRIPLWKRISQKASTTLVPPVAFANTFSSALNNYFPSLSSTTSYSKYPFENDIPIGILSPGIFKSNSRFSETSLNDKGSNLDKKHYSENATVAIDHHFQSPTLESSLHSSTQSNFVVSPTIRNEYDQTIVSEEGPEIQISELTIPSLVNSVHSIIIPSDLETLSKAIELNSTRSIDKIQSSLVEKHILTHVDSTVQSRTQLTANSTSSKPVTNDKNIRVFPDFILEVTIKPTYVDLNGSAVSELPEEKKLGKPYLSLNESHSLANDFKDSSIGDKVNITAEEPNTLLTNTDASHLTNDDDDHKKTAFNYDYVTDNIQESVSLGGGRGESDQAGNDTRQNNENISKVPVDLISENESFITSTSTTTSVRTSSLQYPITSTVTTDIPSHILISAQKPTTEKILLVTLSSAKPSDATVTYAPILPEILPGVIHHNANSSNGSSSGLPNQEEKVIVVVGKEADEPQLHLIRVNQDGTNTTLSSPYVKAAVSYDIKQFCKHRRNIYALLVEWINKHLTNMTDERPYEIEVFYQPECKDVYLLDNDTRLNRTDVYFYVKEDGQISPNLTLQFPKNPTELAISKELDYLKRKILHLELVNSVPLQEDLLIEEAAVGTSIIIAIVITSLLIVLLIASVLVLILIRRKRAAENIHGRRCTPAANDAYSLDSVSVFYHSIRRKSRKRASNKSLKSYLNQGFDDPNGPSRPLNFVKLTHCISDIEGIYDEYSNIPAIIPKYDEIPRGVEDKNRYANVIPVSETRILLNNNSPKDEYINANSVHGPRGELRYYIATQAPLDETVADFWQMVWEQESKVIVMLTDFVEKGIDKCADYLPPSETLDCHRVYGEFQITLKSRDLREKYIVSIVQIKNLENNLVREIAHMWFNGWPHSGVPNEEKFFISFIFDVRTTRKQLRAKGPIIVHCSPGTGRTGTYIACDLALKQFDENKVIDIPKTVYRIRRERAGAVQTKEQYAFIYRVVNLYAAKLTTGNLDSF